MNGVSKDIGLSSDSPPPGTGLTDPVDEAATSERFNGKTAGAAV